MASPNTVQPVDETQLADPAWEQAVGESSKAYGAFLDYLEAGVNRSIRNAALEGGNDYSTCRDWARRWRWTQRASAWDTEMANRRRTEYADEYAEVGRRHARQAQAALEALIRPAIVLLDRMRSDRTFLAELEMMKPADLYSLTMQALRILPHIQAAENVAWGDGVSTAVDAVYLSDVDYDDAHLAAVAATLLDIGAINPSHLEQPALTSGEPE